jgi:hypothetical protein
MRCALRAGNNLISIGVDIRTITINAGSGVTTEGRLSGLW